MNLRSRIFVQKERRTVEGSVLVTLFAVAWERHAWKAGHCFVVDCGVDYLHAEDAARAKFQFWMGLSPKEKKGRHLVNVAPAVGFHVHDEHGDKLSA